MSRARILYSERLEHTVHLGHNQMPSGVSVLRYEDFRNALIKAGLIRAVQAAALPSEPAVWGHGNDLPVYPMHGNGPDDSVAPGFQGCGDCEVARANNLIIEAAINAGRSVPALDGSTAVPVYSQLSGYNVQTGANDNGLYTQQVYTYGQNTGFTDKNGVNYKFGPSFFAEAGNYTIYCEIAYLIEEGGIAWDFSTQMMDQFDAGQPWQYVPGYTSEGGHETAGWGPLHTGSWTRNQGFTQLCYEKQNVEISGVVLMERYNAVTGDTAEHHSDADLEKYIVTIAAQKTGQQPSQGVSIPADLPAQEPVQLPSEDPGAIPAEEPAPVEEPPAEAPVEPAPIEEPPADPAPVEDPAPENPPVEEPAPAEAPAEEPAIV